MDSASGATSGFFRSAFERRLFLIGLPTLVVLSAASALLSSFKVLALVLSLFAIGLAILRPYLIIVLLAVWTPFEPFLLKFVPDELYVYARYFPEALLYVLAALVVAHVLIERRKLPSTPIDFPLIIFLCALAASTLLNLVSPSVLVLGSRQILRYIVLYFTVVYLAPPEKRIKQTIFILLGITFFESCLGVAQAIAQGGFDQYLLPSDRKFFDSIQLTAGVQQFWAPGQRVFATLGRYDQLGTFITFFLLIAAGLAYEAKARIEKRYLIGLFVIALPALVLTYSRASWFGFILGFVVIGLLLKRDKRVALALGLFIAAVASIFLYERVVLRYLVDVPSQTITERFFEAFSPERLRGEYYGLGRVYWIVTTPMVVMRASPFFGFGPGMYGGGAAAALHNTAAYDRLGLPFGVYGTDGQIDSNWMSLWGESGTIGLIAYLAIFFALARTALSVFRGSKEPWTRGFALGYLGALAAITFQALLGTYLEVRTLAMYLWLGGALVAVMAKREQIEV